LDARRLADALRRESVVSIYIPPVAVRELRTDPIVDALQTIAGMGPVLGLTWRAEIGAITRFPDGPHLASFAGWCPPLDISANHTWYGRITRKGSPWIRWALVEVAMHAMKRNDDTGRRARRIAIRKGVLKARVALARMLCEDVVRVWARAD
jgi:transposase